MRVTYNQSSAILPLIARLVSSSFVPRERTTRDLPRRGAEVFQAYFLVLAGFGSSPSAIVGQNYSARIIKTTT
jgi:hypothetical protein